MFEVADRIADRFEDAVWWVDLAPLSDPALVPQAIASALGVREQPGRPLVRTLARELERKQLLVVVDNCEHLIEASASLITHLLRGAPGLCVLATSREPLRSEGETTWPVPALSVPDTGDLPPGRALVEYEAVRLFADRATAVLPSFSIASENGQAVTDICRRLDGLPLAIELAAARIRALSPEQIASRLHDCFAVLGPGSRTGVARQQTLRAAIDWSYDLLTDTERQLLCQLSVFAGSFTLEATERGTARSETGDVLMVLGLLIDKSLVVVVERGAGQPARYRLPETVRQYAREKLRADKDEPAVLARHAEYYLALAEAVEPELTSTARHGGLATLAREHGNVLAALEYATHLGDGGTAARLAGALFWFWFHRGHWSEGRTCLGAALALGPEPSRARARALLGDGVLAWAVGDHGAARSRLEESAAIGQAVNDNATAAHARHFLGMVLLTQGDLPAARRQTEDGVRLARTTEDAFALTLTLASCGVVRLALEDYDDVEALLDESIRRGRAAGDRWVVALPLRNRAIIAARRGDYAAARAGLEESLRGLRDLGERWFLSRSLETLAEVVAAQGEHARAARLFGAAEALREAVGAPILPFYRADYDRAMQATRASLGDERLDRGWAEGRALTLDQALAYALGEWDLAETG